MDPVVRFARTPHLFFRDEGGGGGGGGAVAPDGERGRIGARRFNPPSRSVDPSFYREESFARLAEPVQSALRVILAMVPDRASDAKNLIEQANFTALSGEEQLALLSPPKPDRLDHALAVLQHPGWPVLPQAKLPLLELDAKTQLAMLAQLDHFPALKTGQYLVELAQAPWFIAAGPNDRARAVKIIAYAASALSGATFDDMGYSQKKIIEDAIGSLIGPTPRYELRMEKLAFEESDTIAGTIEFPRTLILNQDAIPPDDRPIFGQREEHVALATLVHEVNHLDNQVEEGPTFASFMDEYRAWFVAFVAFMSRFPTKIEGLYRVKELLTNPSYDALQEAIAAGNSESEKIIAFARKFGDVDNRDEILALELNGNMVLSAPLPEP